MYFKIVNSSADNRITFLQFFMLSYFDLQAKILEKTACVGSNMKQKYFACFINFWTLPFKHYSGFISYVPPPNVGCILMYAHPCHISFCWGNMYDLLLHYITLCKSSCSELDFLHISCTPPVSRLHAKSAQVQMLLCIRCTHILARPCHQH